MKRKCQVCGQENGSCNRYYFSPANIITICLALVIVLVLRLVLKGENENE